MRLNSIDLQKAKSSKGQALVTELEWDVIVVGAGPAGLIAAWRSSERGLRTLLLEKNKKIGVKILMSGGTRCNVTHQTDERGIADAFGSNGRFLLSPLSKFGPADIVELLTDQGVPTKTESTGKIFPCSNRAIDVRDALVARTVNAGATIVNEFAVTELSFDNNRFLVCGSQGQFHCRALIVTTGGKSYPGCGTTGDGYRWAEQFGHTIVQTYPALAPIVCGEGWIANLRGVTIADCDLAVVDSKQKIMGHCRSSLLFTHFGFSGPAAMNVSRQLEKNPESKKLLRIDFSPATDRGSWAQQALELRKQNPGKSIINALPPILPRRLIEQLVLNSGISPQQKCSEVSNAKWASWIDQLKATTVSVAGTRGFAKAEVTAGGVSLNEIDGTRMESKCKPGLFFAGEILDLDGPIGGYNFQSAFSTGFVAGENVCRADRNALERA